MKKLKCFLLLLLILNISTCATIRGKQDTGYITIVAVGDNLFHEALIKNGEDGNYEEIYSEIRSIVEKTDIAFINQETLLAGKAFGFSGYPLFNSPQKLGEAIRAAGFNVVNQANNHVMDKGEKAIIATMDFWDKTPEVTVLGIHRNAEARARPKLIKKHNVTFGFLSYTYGTNGIAVPKDKPYLVSLINTEIMKKEIAALRPLCDFLVVSMHWGEEYQHSYNKTQSGLAAFLAEQEVDLVIGQHPHFIQGVEYLARPSGKRMLCFYSLGNFMSAQTQRDSLLGAMAYIKIKGGNTIEVAEAGAIPLVTHYNKNYSGFKVYPLHAYSDELAAQHMRSYVNKDFTLNYLSGLSTRIFGDKEIKRNPFTQ